MLRLAPVFLLLACAQITPARNDESVPPAPIDPALEEVPLPAEPGWNASLVIDHDVGIWTVAAYQVFPQFGCPEVVGLDDRGRCIVLISYSGTWTPLMPTYDGRWLGGLAHADLDPRFPGAELYVGSQRGNVYELVAYPHTVLDARLIAHLEGREVHTVAAHEDGLLAFTRPGALFLLTPTGENGGFEARKLEDINGRVRHTVTLPTGEIATAWRAGQVKLLTLTPGGAQWEVVYDVPMGLGRIALRPAREGEPTVLYVTRDDGIVVRLERGADRTWADEAIYAGPQGPRGIAAGRFDEDPDVETVAVFGYSRKVQLLARRADGWEVETIFHDEDKGHWLAAAELDGRNGTDELLACGFGRRIVLLARPPGYGLAVTTEPEPEPEREPAAAAASTADG